MIRCDNCKASQQIKDSLGCNGDRLFHYFEILKHEFFKTFKVDYTPKFQCRFADLVEEEQNEF